ncbi:MAG: sensor histidine kinase [Methanobacterium sp.]|nr:sensor histidine kinase [Methanobacterium sp.]
MQADSASDEKILLSELSVIYSISSMGFFQDENDILKVALNIATISFGVRYFGLLYGDNGNYCVKVSNGFRDLKDLMKKINGRREPNQFLFSFMNLDTPMVLFMEHRNPVTDRERRVYTIFAKKLETALNNASNLQEKIVAEKELKKSLNEKELLLREIYHRVKNNMQIISSMLSLQTNYVGDESINVIQETQNRVKAMAMVHEELYHSKDLTRIDFADYMRSLIFDLFYFYNVDTRRVNCSMVIDDVFFEIETAIPLGLIVNELVSNSLKYAFPEDSNGNITVKIQNHHDHYQLYVMDDGVGISEDVDLNTTNTLGFQLVKALTRQLDGEISLDRKDGTEFKIVFKELKYQRRI